MNGKTHGLRRPTAGDPCQPEQTAEGYSYQQDWEAHPNLASARIVAEVLSRQFHFRSVVDVGCGLGVWLRAFKDQFACEVLGIDGDWVPREHLAIPEDRLLRLDISKQHVEETRRFDLAICLEVAEHLPPTAGDRLLTTLCALSDTVLFSAAVPGQGGNHHINEQFQDHWRDKFRIRGLRAFDPVRPHIWEDGRVQYWYAQNILMYSRDDLQVPEAKMVSLVHPKLYEDQRNVDRHSWMSLVTSLARRPVNRLVRLVGSRRRAK